MQCSGSFWVIRRYRYLSFIPCPSATLLTTKDDQTDEQHEITHWAVLKIPSRKEFWVRSYEGAEWRRFRIGDIDFDGQGHHFSSFRVSSGGLNVVDVAL